jgi:hypothetical protein
VSTLHFLDSTLSAPGRRTSVSAPIGIQPQPPAPLGSERVGTANAPSGHGLYGCSMTEADEPRTMAWHRNDVGLSRSKSVSAHRHEGLPNKSPAERTQRSAPPPPCLWPLADDVLGWTPNGRGPSRSRFVLCPSELCLPDKRPAERTQRSALPPRDCRVHPNGCLGLDAQRLRNSEFDGARAHSVRSTSGGPEGAQEGSRGFRDSGTPGQPSPTQPEPRQGFQRSRHNAFLMVTSPHHAAVGRRTFGFQPDGPRALPPTSPLRSTD